MKIAVISHKKSWRGGESPTGVVTIGGFPQQMAALAELFSQMVIYLPAEASPIPQEAMPLSGRNLSVISLTPLPERGLRRKLAMLTWLPRNLPTLWRGVRAADAVHTPIPSDIGLVGLFVALAQAKPLFVRHCSLWGQTFTLTGRFLHWLLERIAGRNQIVVMATGGSDQPPSPNNPAIQWIFSSSLTAAQWANLPQSRPWPGDQPLRLVTVGRMEPVKNTAIILQAVAQLRSSFRPGLHLDLVGDGTTLASLKAQATALGLNDLVTFHGNLAHEKVLNVLAQAHLFLLPSHFEGFPKAALEAMACGLPVIATKVSVLPQLVKENGLLLEKPTVENLVQAISQISQQPQKMAIMAAGARAESQHYTLDGWRQTIGDRLNQSWQPTGVKQL